MRNAVIKSWRAAIAPALICAAIGSALVLQGQSVRAPLALPNGGDVRTWETCSASAAPSGGSGRRAGSVDICADGTWYSWDGSSTWTKMSGGGGGGTPGGADGDVQVNDSGVFAGFGDWDGTRLLLDGGGIGPGVTAAAWTDFVTNGWIPSFGTLFAGDATQLGYETESFGNLYNFILGGTRASPTAAAADQYGPGTFWYASKDGTSSSYTSYARFQTYFNEHEEGNGVGTGGLILTGYNKAGTSQRSELVLDGAARTAQFTVGGAQMLLVDGANDVVRLPLLTSNGVVATSGGNGTLGVDATITAGTWTPTLTNGANLDGSTAFQCQYLRIGATVTGSCRLSVDPTTTVTSTQLGVSLPVASNFGAVEDAAGSCGGETVAGETAAVRADASNDRLEVRWQAADVTEHVVTCSFSYQVL